MPHLPNHREGLRRAHDVAMPEVKQQVSLKRAGARLTLINCGSSLERTHPRIPICGRCVSDEPPIPTMPIVGRMTTFGASLA